MRHHATSKTFRQVLACLLFAALTLTCVASTILAPATNISGNGTGTTLASDRQPRRLGGIVVSGRTITIRAQTATDGILTLFLPSHPCLSELRIFATDQSGRILPMLVSDSDDEPDKLVIAPQPVTSVLPSPSLAELSATGQTDMWIRAGTGQETCKETTKETDETGDDADGTTTHAGTGTSQTPVRLRLVRSEGTESVVIETKMPRDYVEADKGNEANGTVSVTSPSGMTLYDGSLSRITGRGNFTWSLAKKPFNIRLASKADLVGSGEPHKSWCLLADAYDPTGLRNLVTLRLAKALGLAETPECTPVDLWWNGEYRGSYLLTEKIGIWSGGINAPDLDKAHKRANAANPETARAYDEDIVEEGTGPTGMATCYAVGVIAPERVLEGDLSGLLVEHDERDAPGACWFDTSIGRFVIKEPDVASRELVESAQERFERAFTCLYSGGEEDDWGCSAPDYFEIGSLARCSWLYAVAGEADYMRCSSSYFFVGNDGLIHAGPAWDFDLSWANRPADQPEYADLGYRNNFETHVLDEGNDKLRRVIADETHPVLSALVNDVLLGEKGTKPDAGGLQSLSWYARRTEATRRMDGLLWGQDDAIHEEALATFRKGLRARVERADAIVRDWDEENDRTANETEDEEGDETIDEESDETANEAEDGTEDEE